jgi:hypothetical protein
VANIQRIIIFLRGSDNRCLCMMVATLTCCKVLPLLLVNLLETVTTFLFGASSEAFLFRAITCGSLHADNNIDAFICYGFPGL